MQFAELQKQMIAAMKAKDKVRKEAISSLVSAAKKVAIDEGCRDDISEEIVGRVILKEMKTDECGRSGKLHHRKICRCRSDKKYGTDHESRYGGSERKSRRKSDQCDREETLPVGKNRDDR